MKILHISSIKNIKGNGVAVAISEYLKNEKKYCDVAVYSLKTPIIVDNIDCFDYKEFNKISLLPNGYNKPDLVIFNEVYKKEYIKLYKECLKNKTPYIIIPHGCLVKTAQKKKRLKKLFGNILLFNKFIKKAKAIQFLNNEEKNTSVTKNKNSFISGNGIYKSNIKNENTNNDLVYIGRYDIQTKGLDLIVNICKNNKDWFIKNNVKVKLYGRDSYNGKACLEEQIKGYEDVITINGEVYNNEKLEILKNSYAFIQVSRHEAQPMGIMDALSIGLPCIVTYQTNFGEFVDKYKCGIGVDLNEKSIFEGIKELYKNKKLRNEFSENGIKYANDIYNWDIVSKDCIEKYSKLVLGE